MAIVNNSAAISAVNNVELGVKDMMNEEVLYTMIDFALPNNRNQVTDNAGWNKMADMQDNLMEFCKKHKFQLVPAPEAVVVVQRKANKQIPSALASAMIALGTEFIAAIEKTEKGITKLFTPTSEKKLFLKGGETVSMSPYEVEAHKDITLVYADQFANWFMLFVANQLAKLSNEQKLELISLFPNTIAVDANAKYTAEVHKDNGRGVFVNLVERRIVARQERVATAKISIYNSEVSTDAAILTLLQFIANKNNEGKNTNAILNALPNMWEREPNYGVDLDETDPPRLIMDGVAMPIDFKVEDISGNSLNVWPWVMPVNADFNISILDEFLARGKALVVD